MPQDIEVYIRLIASCCRQLVEELLFPLRSAFLSHFIYYFFHVVPASISLLLEVML